MSRRQLLDPNKKGPEAEALEARLRQLVIGQDDAIVKIVEAYQAFRTGMSPVGRPAGNFLFLGTDRLRENSRCGGNRRSPLKNPAGVVKIDCAEYQHSHEIAKLIGSPPGYLGHRETHALLSQEALNRHHTEELKLSFVLFDEIEKASDSLWNLLLGILDKGTLTLGDNRRVDFSRSMIFMTSNLGAAEMSALAAPRLGFHAACSGDGASKAKLNGKITTTGVAAARRKFTPEFMNRLDHIVVFRSLGEPELRRIVDIELEIVQERIALRRGTIDFLHSRGGERERVPAFGGHRRALRGEATQTCDRTPARPPALESDGKRTDPPRRLHSRQPCPGCSPTCCFPARTRLSKPGALVARRLDSVDSFSVTPAVFAAGSFPSAFATSSRASVLPRPTPGHPHEPQPLALFPANRPTPNPNPQPRRAELRQEASAPAAADHHHSPCSIRMSRRFSNFRRGITRRQMANGMRIPLRYRDADQYRHS